MLKLEQVEEHLEVVVEHGFVHVADNIRTFFKDGEAADKKSLDRYLWLLIIDFRGNRQGFPQDVLTALLKIHNLIPAEKHSIVWGETSRNMG